MTNLQLSELEDEGDVGGDAPSPRGSRPHLAVAAPVRGRAQHDPVTSRVRREALRTSGLSELLERRPELAGVHAPADLAAEALRWSV